MHNEKALCKHMDEQRNYSFRNEMESDGGGHPGDTLLASKICLSTDTCFLSKPRAYFQGHVRWMEFLVQRKTNCLKYILP